jgi:hypothetical protein
MKLLQLKPTKADQATNQALAGEVVDVEQARLLIAFNLADDDSVETALRGLLPSWLLTASVEPS